jgi:predicted AlkP superfamily phosphohydrolase/phosphomutase
LNPGKFGIFWWENIDKQNRRVYFPDERKHNQEEIWTILSDSGQRVCIIGTPLTYPPKKVNGVMVAGGLDCQNKGYTYPPSLQNRLEETHDYRVHPESSIKTEPQKTAAEIHELIRSRFKIAFDLLKDDHYDFVQITTFYLNVLQHFLWDDEATKTGWKIVDECLGELLRREPDANIFLMSDHGSNRIDTVVNLNRWLYENGYLEYTWRYSVIRALADVGVTQDNLRELLKRVGLKDLIQRIVPSEVKNAVPNSHGELKQEAKTHIVDWDRSSAIASGQGPVYVLNESKKAEIKRALEQFETADGRSPFRSVYDRDEMYEGEFLDEAPDLIVDQNDHVHIRGHIGASETVDSPDTDVWLAENKREGMLVGYGPDVGGTIEGTPSILDLAPTILDIHEVDVPANLDGESLF